MPTQKEKQIVRELAREYMALERIANLILWTEVASDVLSQYYGE